MSYHKHLLSRYIFLFFKALGPLHCRLYSMIVAIPGHLLYYFATTEPVSGAARNVSDIGVFISPLDQTQSNRVGYFLFFFFSFFFFVSFPVFPKHYSPLTVTTLLAYSADDKL